VQATLHGRCTRGYAARAASRVIQNWLRLSGPVSGWVRSRLTSLDRSNFTRVAEAITVLPRASRKSGKKEEVLLFRQLTRKVYQDTSAVSEGSRPSLGSRMPSYEFDGGNPLSKHYQWRRLRRPLTALRQPDSDISSTPHSVPRESNLSKPSPIPPPLSPRCLDAHVISGSWVPSPNASTKRPATDRNTSNKNVGTLVLKTKVTLVCSIQNQKLYFSSTFVACCRSSR